MRQAWALLLLLSCAVQGAEPDATQRFRESCAACHGREPAAAFANATRVRGATDEALATLIRTGIPGTAMPAFGQRFSDVELRGLVGLLRDATRVSTQGVGSTIEAETVNAQRSYGYAIANPERGADAYLQYIDRGSYLCY